MAGLQKIGRPRDTRRDRDLLSAAQDVLAEVGYDKLSMEAVASRVGAGRATVYRRWRDKSELVIDAIAALHWDTPAPNTGALRMDLLALGAAYFEADPRRDAVFAGVLTAMVRDAELRRAVERSVAAPRRDAFATIVRHAIQRGEVVPTTDYGFIGQLFPAMTFHQLIMRAQPVDREFVISVIDDLIIPLLTRCSP